MASSIGLLALIVAAFAVTMIESRAVPPVDDLAMPVMLDVFGNPLMIIRDKRASYHPYPQRTMMFTGFYRPARQSAGDQASGVYAQGNAVGGGAYFGQPQYLKDGPEPVDEPEIASADAEAAPAAPENESDEPVDEQHEQVPEEEQHKEEHEEAVADQPQDSPADNGTEKPQADQESIEPLLTTPKPTKGQTKKGKKIPVPVNDEDEDEDEDEDDEPISPFFPVKPGKGGRKNKNYPSLNNFFPMVFSFPRGTGRRGSSSDNSETLPGLITAIANSYSTGKGGVASSVATAYGGSPTKKQRRPSASAQ